MNKYIIVKPGKMAKLGMEKPAEKQHGADFRWINWYDHVDQLTTDESLHISCPEDWKVGEIKEEGVHFKFEQRYVGADNPVLVAEDFAAVAVPLAEEKERVFTLKEAIEIWHHGYGTGHWTERDQENEQKEIFFRKKFGITISNPINHE
jgi:hypothetical protein